MYARRPATSKRVAVLSGVLVLAGTVAGCSSTGHEGLGTETARVVIDGTEVEDRLVVDCNQAQWVWFIESAPKTPGFTAQVGTGATVSGRLVRIAGLGGFTGTAWNTADTSPSDPTAPRVDAEVTDGTFVISGTATGSYDDDPTESATARFEIRADC